VRGMGEGGLLNKATRGVVRALHHLASSKKTNGLSLGDREGYASKRGREMSQTVSLSNGRRTAGKHALYWYYVSLFWIRMPTVFLQYGVQGDGGHEPQEIVDHRSLGYSSGLQPAQPPSKFDFGRYLDTSTCLYICLRTWLEVSTQTSLSPVLVRFIPEQMVGRLKDALHIALHSCRSEVWPKSNAASFLPIAVPLKWRQPRQNFHITGLVPI
jgi:hypothetical protein